VGFSDRLRNVPIFDGCTLIFGIAMGIANFVVYYHFSYADRQQCPGLSKYIVFVAYTSIILTGVLILTLICDIVTYGAAYLTKDECTRLEDNKQNYCFHLVHGVTLLTLLTGLAYSGVAARQWYGSTDGTYQECRTQLRRMAVSDFVIILICSFFQFLFGIYRLWEYTHMLDSEEHLHHHRDAPRSSV